MYLGAYILRRRYPPTKCLKYFMVTAKVLKQSSFYWQELQLDLNEFLEDYNDMKDGGPSLIFSPENVAGEGAEGF